MKRRGDVFLSTAILFAIVFKFIVLRSLVPSVFPTYYFYFVIGIGVFIIARKIDFSVISLFYKPIYVVIILFLIPIIIIGQVTRGAVRWIPIGWITIQPSKIVRPLIIVPIRNKMLTT